MGESPWVVGVGASAGGVEALRELLPLLPGGDVAYVVAQHMSPVHPSLLLQVLARETELTVVEITDRMVLRPGVIHVAPPNRDVRSAGGLLLTEQATPRISPQPSIDVLLESLAATFGPRAIGVVLSGTGSDGVRGVEALRQAGGHTIAQDPDTAGYRDMPTAAIDSGMVGLVLKPDQMGNAISALMRGELVRGLERWSEDTAMSALARETRRVTGWDLTAYKDGTVGRQLAKRIKALGLSTREQYVVHAAEHPEELVGLRDSMLISVTDFLRDRRSFDALSDCVEALVRTKQPGEVLRCWVAGCATGEEAYSITMLVLEAVRRQGLDLSVKVFATDISDSAMESARKGAYPIASAQSIPPEWLDRYFDVDVDGGRIVVRKSLREIVVFARQDITRDPPLVRMDLVSCRNLLIYLVPSVQHRVLTNFHAALNEEGLLFLGRSEAGPGNSELFTPLSASHKVFRRAQRRASVTYRTPAPPVLPPPQRVATSRGGERSAVRDDVRDRLLVQFGPPAVLVDSSWTPVHQVGDVTPFLGLPDVDRDYVLPDMILASLRTEVTTLLTRVSQGEATSASAPVVARFDDDRAERITLHVSRMGVSGQGSSYFLVAFVPGGDEHVYVRPRREPQDGDVGDLQDHIGSLETELAGTREHLQAVVEELETSNEELQAMNEELQASSEELQATNEELETTNEELQATNEELTTVNETLEVRTSELTETNVVLQNIQDAVHTAIVLVDLDLRVQSFSPLAVKVFGLTRADIGVDLSRLPSHVDMALVRSLVLDVIAGGEGQVSEVSTSTASYLLQVVPYRVYDEVTGAILALSEITELSAARADLAGRAEEFQILAEALPHMLFRADVAMTRYTYVSPSSTLLCGLTPEQICGDPAAFLALVPDEDRLRLAALRSSRFASDQACDYTIVTPDGETRHVRELNQVVDVDPLHAYRVGTLIDITDLRQALDEAERQRARAEGIYDLGGLPMAVLGHDGTITRANGYLVDLLGLDPSRIVGHHLSSFSVPDQVEVVREAVERVVSGASDEVELSTRMTSVTGREVHAVQRLATIRPAGASAEDTFVFCAVFDITATEQARRASEMRQEEFESVFSHTGAAMAILGSDGRLERCNDALCALLGRTREELALLHLSDITHPEDVAADMVLFGELVKGQRSAYAMEKRFVTSDGRIVWARLMVSTTPSEVRSEGRMTIMTVLDISEERRREAAALRLSQSDPLTGLSNRALVFDRLRQSILRAHRNGEHVSVLFVDLDGFKGINDRLGHESGDRVLCAVADRLRTLTRESDSVSRLGGDEFLVVAPHDGGESPHEGMRLADRLLRAINEQIEVGGGGVPEGARDGSPLSHLRLSASIGLAQYPTDGDDVEELVRRADTAMYAAKQRGGGQVHFYSERLQDTARMRASQRSELGSAVEEGQIRPWYQPIVDAGTHELCGLEVLARWEHPRRGILLPADFIELATEFNVLDALTINLVSQVLRDLDVLLPIAPDLRVSLNLTAPQLCRPSVVSTLLEMAGPLLDHWTVEVTEAAAFPDVDGVAESLRRLKAAGARTSLDDFGTGYSSILHLRDFGFDEVKIDRAFVSRVDGPEGTSLLQAIVMLAKALGAESVGEGVETEEQAAMLTELGVDLVQGFLVSRPSPVQEVASWMSHHQRMRQRA